MFCLSFVELKCVYCWGSSNNNSSYPPIRKFSKRLFSEKFCKNIFLNICNPFTIPYLMYSHQHNDWTIEVSENNLPLSPLIFFENNENRFRTFSVAQYSRNSLFKRQKSSKPVKKSRREIQELVWKKTLFYNNHYTSKSLLYYKIVQWKISTHPITISDTWDPLNNNVAYRI